MVKFRTSNGNVIYLRIREGAELMKPLYWGILGAIVLILAAYVGFDYLYVTPGPATLAKQALSASDLEGRKLAAVKLTMFKDFHEVVPHLRTVAKETQDPEVLAVAINGL